MATITIGLMDPPYESNNTPTAFRIIDAAIKKGHNVNVFLYEGAVALGFDEQAPHPNPVKGSSVEEQEHPLPKDWVKALMAHAKEQEVEFHWMNCGLCVDERGVGKQVAGAERGGPANFHQWAEPSDGVLFITTK